MCFAVVQLPTACTTISVLVIASDSRKVHNIQLYTCITSRFDVDAMCLLYGVKQCIFLSNQ